MIFDWYKVINKTEFEATGLVSQNVDVILQGIGRKSVLVTRGNLTAITYDGVFLPLEMTSDNPFIFDGHAVYLDAADDIWLGIENEN